MDKGEKLLQLNICFKLPADFRGDLNDALDALVKYRRGEKNHNKIFTPDKNASVYDNWWTMIHETDRVLYGSIGLDEYTAEDGEEWKAMEI